MSLKAKLEAVIYAAEEPVTLAQLALLFGNEALEWKAEQQAARAAQAQENAEAAADPINAEFDFVDTSNVSAEEPVIEPRAETAPPGEAAAAPAPHSAEPPAPETAEAEPAASSDEEFRKAARQRDREVRAILRQLLDEIVASYAADSRGIEIREIAGGFRMATKPEFHDAVRAFIKSQKPPLKLSLPALETLAVIAYKQPVTAPEVNEIRGVDSSGVFGSLLARKLIATAGRKQVVGRPILYKTTKEFLMRFGLKDLSELPSMEEFEKMAAGELDEFEAAPAALEGAAPNPELDENASEEEPGQTAAATSPQAAESAAEPPEPQPESNPSGPAPPGAE